MLFRRHYIFLLSVFVLAACSTQQRLTKEAYLNGFDDKAPFTSIENQGEEADSVKRIYLIRHAKPDVAKKFMCTAQMAQDYVRAYNQVSIIPFDSSLVKVELEASTPIYCSSLVRAQQTAEAIFDSTFTIVSYPLFREFETKIVRAPNAYKLPLIVWQSISRLTWIVGLNQHGIESYREAKTRADVASQELMKLAEENQTVVLVAHGMLNRALAKRLQKAGWKVLQKQGHINIGATVLEKGE